MTSASVDVSSASLRLPRDPQHRRRGLVQLLGDLLPDVEVDEAAGQRHVPDHRDSQPLGLTPEGERVLLAALGDEVGRVALLGGRSGARPRCAWG